MKLRLALLGVVLSGAALAQAPKLTPLHAELKRLGILESADAAGGRFGAMKAYTLQFLN